MLIKPRTDFIDSGLPLDDRHYVACEPDFSISAGVERTVTSSQLALGREKD